jgi:hypothetical protein
MVAEAAISSIVAGSSIEAMLARRMLSGKFKGAPMNHTVTLVRAATKKKDLPARKPIKGGLTAKYAR